MKEKKLTLQILSLLVIGTKTKAVRHGEEVLLKWFQTLERILIMKATAVQVPEFEDHGFSSVHKFVFCGENFEYHALPIH